MAKKRIFSKYVLPIIAIVLLVFAASKVFAPKDKPSKETALPPFTSEYKMKVAGIGIVEPQSEIISIAPNIEGVIISVPVKAGNQVKAGDALFTIDDRSAKAQLQSAQAEVEVAKIAKQDAETKFSYYQKLSDKTAVSREEYTRVEFEFKRADANLKTANARVNEIKTTIDRLTVKAPLDAEILKVNARPGEYASANPSRPLLVIGDTKIMNVRVEIDETDAQRFQMQGAAKGSLRNQNENSVDLQFVRIEPLLAAKAQLTGDGNELVDTRVLQVIYSFDNAKLKSFPGQQMDVFISTE